MSEDLEAKLQTLLSAPPISGGRAPRDMPSRGVYLFTELNQHLYVGRSTDLSDCYIRHCSARGWHRHAPFAVCLASRWLGYDVLGYRPGGPTQKNPILDSKSARAFTKAKARIRAMDFRYIEVTDPRRAALFEIYCSVALQIPYTDFEHAHQANKQALDRSKTEYLAVDLVPCAV